MTTPSKIKPYHCWSFQSQGFNEPVSIKGFSLHFEKNAALGAIDYRVPCLTRKVYLIARLSKQMPHVLSTTQHGYAEYSNHIVFKFLLRNGKTINL